MGRAKEIIVKVIPERLATPFVKAHHYSGKVVQNSQLHLGCFLDGGLHGVMSFGPSLDKRKILGLVKTENKSEATKWNEFLELNRMAFDDYLPANSESRCLGIAFRMIRKNAPHIKYVVSFSDATASGDGTIYRASGFRLTQIKENKTILVMPDGERITILNFTNGYTEKKRICAKYGLPIWGGGKCEATLGNRGEVCDRVSVAIYQTADTRLPPRRPGNPVHGYRQGRGGYVPRSCEHQGQPPQKSGALRRELLLSEKVFPQAISVLDARRSTLSYSRVLKQR